jgi:hypothetical protein
MKFSLQNVVFKLKTGQWIMYKNSIIVGLEIGDSSIDWAQISRILSEEKGRVQIPKHCAQNYWVFGLCPSPSILKTRKHSFSET